VIGGSSGNIDERLEELPLWHCSRDDVLRAILDYYRLLRETILTFAAPAIDSYNKEFR